jgi:predicted outer membrane repeat protein
VIGDATISGVSAHGNLAGGKGGGVYAVGEAVITGSGFARNRATDGGGAFVSASDTATDVTISGSSFADNTATVRGGGIAANGVRALDVTNSTVARNYAPRGGGIAVADEPPGGAEEVFLHFSTIAGNTSPLGANVSSEVRLETYGSVLVEPLGGGTGCAVDPGDRYPWGYSFLSDVTCGLHPTDVVSAADPQLGPLDPEPFPPARTPAPTSPIAGLVPALACDVGTDQHGTPRPQGGACEAGSIEIVEAGPG